MDDKEKLVNIHKKLIWVVIIFFLYRNFKKWASNVLIEKDYQKKRNLLVLGKKKLKLKEKTYLIQFMSCGAFEESIWGILETMLDFFEGPIKVLCELDFKDFLWFFDDFFWCLKS